MPLEKGYSLQVKKSNKEWTLTPDVEEVAILVDGKPYKCAIAHNLGQVRKLLEGDYKNYDIIRLMA